MALSNKCLKCGCEDSFLTSPLPCSNTTECSSPEICDFVIPAKCVIYTGEPIMCGDTVVVPSNTNITTALQLVVSFNCNL
jgi:hypothetical protein